MTSWNSCGLQNFLIGLHNDKSLQSKKETRKRFRTLDKKLLATKKKPFERQEMLPLSLTHWTEAFKLTFLRDAAFVHLRFKQFQRRTILQKDAYKKTCRSFSNFVLAYNPKQFGQFVFFYLRVWSRISFQWIISRGTGHSIQVSIDALQQTTNMSRTEEAEKVNTWEQARPEGLMVEVDALQRLRSICSHLTVTSEYRRSVL
jgi:hypothetical protein